MTGDRHIIEWPLFWIEYEELADGSWKMVAHGDMPRAKS